MSRLQPLARSLATGVAVLVSIASLGGCAQWQQANTQASSLGGLVTPYRIDILQGNVVVREQLEALQLGMPRDMVRNILGTPLLASAFHAHRWDYVFTLQRQGQDAQQRRVTVFFDDDTLSRIDADELPTEEDFVASLVTRRALGKAPPLQATDEQLNAFEQRHNRTATPVDPLVLPPSGVNYPPLESR